MRTHTKYDLTLWRGDWHHRASFPSVISQRAQGPTPYGTEGLWKVLEKEVVNVKSEDHIESTGLLHVFAYSQTLSIFFVHLSALVFTPPFFLHPCSIFFSLTSILLSPPIPSYTLCPLTLNHRWTKQWAMSHSIKTNNPLMEGGLCGAGATVTRQYTHWVQAATNLKPQWYNSQMDIKGSLYAHTLTQRRKQKLYFRNFCQVEFLSFLAAAIVTHYFLLLSPLLRHSPLSFFSLIHQWEVWNW